MPVPGSRFEAKMMLASKMRKQKSTQANCNENCANYHVQAVKTSCHIECGTIDTIRD